MQTIVWAGGGAAALLAIGVFLRALARRIVAGAIWTAAAIQLPTTVDGLAHSVEDLSSSVDRLTRVVDGITTTHPFLESA